AVLLNAINDRRRLLRAEPQPVHATVDFQPQPHRLRQFGSGAVGQLLFVVQRQLQIQLSSLLPFLCIISALQHQHRPLNTGLTQGNRLVHTGHGKAIGAAQRACAVHQTMTIAIGLDHGVGFAIGVGAVKFVVVAQMRPIEQSAGRTCHERGNSRQKEYNRAHRHRSPARPPWSPLCQAGLPNSSRNYVMPSHPLFSDKTIALSATLAATIGLEEAVLLTVLNDAASLQNQAWARLGKQALRQQLPFWDDVTIRRILQNLLDKGLLTLSGPMFPDAEGLMFSFTPPAGQPQASAPAPQPRPAVAEPRPRPATATPMNPPAAPPANLKQPLPERWRPNTETLQRLEQHGIPASFSWSQL